MKRLLLPVCAAVGLLAACSTPRPVLDQANNTARLLVLLQTQVAELRQLHMAALNARNEALFEREKRLKELVAMAELDEEASQSAGLSASLNLRKELLANADAVAQSSAALVTVAAESASVGQSALVAIPNLDKPLAEAQRKAAVLGTELSQKERREELLAFAQDAIDALKAAQAKVQAAKAAASGAASVASAAAVVDTSTTAASVPP